MQVITKFKSRYEAIQKTLNAMDVKGLTRFLAIFDLVYCRLFIHCTYEEYLQYKFYNFKNRYRKNFMLTYHQRNFMRYLNTPGFTLFKYKFYLHIPHHYAREIILAPACGVDTFLSFVKKHGTIVTKPDGGSYGRDIKIFHYTTDEEAIAFLRSLTENTVCEEFIRQHEVMEQLNPSSVNTIRILSLRKNDEIIITSASLRTAADGDHLVDNMRKGGIGAQVDVETGIVYTYGYDYAGNKYIVHPITGCSFMGLQIPNCDKAIDLVKNAHSEIPECDYLGWDIAITQDGADIIEANTAPGPMLTQFMDLIPKGEAVLPLLKKRIRTKIGPNNTKPSRRTIRPKKTKK